MMNDMNQSDLFHADETLRWEDYYFEEEQVYITFVPDEIWLQKWGF